jgi:hydrogenase maturation protease
MNDDKTRILLYGYGNPSRQDDGLGIFCIQEIEKYFAGTYLEKLISYEYNYQLNIEDILHLLNYDLIIFADSSDEAELAEYTFSKLKPAHYSHFSTHHMSPAALLKLLEQLYGKHANAWLLRIKGYEWELNEEMTTDAKANLRKAMKMLSHLLPDYKDLIHHEFTI